RQRGFSRWKYLEVLGEGCGRARIGHVAGGILEPDDALSEHPEQSADQPDVPGQPRLLREMVEIDRDWMPCGRAHDGADIGHEAVVRDALIVERRQHQRARKSKLCGVPG